MQVLYTKAASSAKPIMLKLRTCTVKDAHSFYFLTPSKP
jgi:hypothetical protein